MNAVIYAIINNNSLFCHWKSTFLLLYWSASTELVFRAIHTRVSKFSRATNQKRFVSKPSRCTHFMQQHVNIPRKKTATDQFQGEK